MRSVDRNQLAEHLLNLSRIAHRSTSTSCIRDRADFTGLNHEVALTGTVLYTDFGGSTALVEEYDKEFAVWILRAYLHCASLAVRSFGGTVTAFEGDGIMAIFASAKMEDRAVRCAFGIQWLVDNAIQSAQTKLYPAIAYKMHQVVGIDSSLLYAVRTDVWDEYDILWVGAAANNAANFTRIRDDRFSTHVTPSVHDRLSAELLASRAGPVWSKTRVPGTGNHVFSAGIGQGF